MEAAKSSVLSKAKLEKLYKEKGTYGKPPIQKYLPHCSFARMGILGFGHKEAITGKVRVIVNGDIRTM